MVVDHPLHRVVVELLSVVADPYLRRPKHLATYRELIYSKLRGACFREGLPRKSTKILQHPQHLGVSIQLISSSSYLDLAQEQEVKCTTSPTFILCTVAANGRQ